VTFKEEEIGGLYAEELANHIKLSVTFTIRVQMLWFLFLILNETAIFEFIQRR